MKKNRFIGLLPCLTLTVMVIVSFIFFQFWYPYHLFRREQTMIFLMDSEFVSRYFTHPGWLSALAGDFMTQFYYYVGAGAVIISLSLGLLWTAVWLNAKQLFKGTALPTAIATVVTAWELLRECGETYTLGSTIGLIGVFALLLILLKVRNRIANPLVATAAIAVGYWCFGYNALILAALVAASSAAMRQWVSCAVGVIAIVLMPKDSLKQAEWFALPNFAQEHKLAIDSEAYFGNWEKVLQLSQQGEMTKYSSFYYYLINSLMGTLPDAVLTRMPKDADGLLPTMDPKKNSIDLSALGEAWYCMGDMTAAEHCTIVAMISSSRYTGSRYLKRMAEINLANGDDEAAMKYLRMLSKTLCHAKWAKSHMPGNETETTKARREDASRLIVDYDTVRYVNDYVTTLRHLVKGNPDNDMAYDFLLCYHLLNRDIKSFVEDYDPKRHTPLLYQQALLVYLSIIDADADEIDKYDISEPTIDGFISFNEMLPMTESNRSQIANRFGNTFWYFYQVGQ